MLTLVRALLEAACCLIAHSILPALKGVKHLSLPTGVRFFNIINHNHHHFELSCFQAARVTLVVQEGIRNKSERNNHPLHGIPFSLIPSHMTSAADGITLVSLPYQSHVQAQTIS